LENKKIQKKAQQGNKNNHKKVVNLVGIGLGNGWMDATVQGPAVIDYAWWHGMIDSTTKNALHAVWQVCKDDLKSADNPPLPPPFHEFTVPDECNIMGAVMEAAGVGIFEDKRPNEYDVTTWDYYPILWDDNSTFGQFYNNPKVKQALHAPMEKEWLGCIPGAGRRRQRQRQRHLQKEEALLLPGKTLLAHDVPVSVVPYVAELLDEGGIQVLIYNADRDLTTCSQGSELLLDDMDWSGHSEWKSATRGLWMVQEQVAGYAKTHANLTFLVVINSGHLVPHNVPVPALDLITRFVTGTPFLDIELPSFAAPSLLSSVSSSSEVIKENNSRHDQYVFSAVSLAVVAVVCFLAGMFVASSLRKNKHDYQRVGDVKL
jgi:hypothetical protein